MTSNPLPHAFRRTLAAVAGGVLFLPAVHAESPASNDDAGIQFFEKKVRPILVNHCYQCHSAETKAAGGLRVDDRNGLLIGGDEGAAVIAGDPEHSLLLERIKLENAKRRMPKEGELLNESEIADLTTWIKEGVAWPRERIPASLGKSREDYEKLKAKHWAWQPLTEPKAPEVADAAWPKDNIDRFILSTLEAKKLPPVADANRITLIRRVTYDLTGLPPTPAEIEAFQKDTAPDAFAQVVDRLLAAPQFGERWGRHWLDVARYGESTGPSRNIPYPFAWKYRDYVIDAVNRDVPFDRFIQEQIAGDLLPAADSKQRDVQLTATGFLALGVKDVNQRFKTRFIMDNVDEQIDTVSRSVLGLTVSCARCHDHKFDPIPVTDYYAMAGIFTSTDDCAGVRNKMGGGGLDYYVPSMLVRLTSSDVPPPAAEEVEKLQAAVAEAKKAWDEIRGTPEGLKKGPNGQPTQRPFRVKYEKAQAEFLALTDPAAHGLAVHGVRDSKAIADTEVRIRGEAERLGPTVPRGFLTTFDVPGAEPVKAGESGRLELAQWLTSAKNPLTPRVAVNRIWEHLFGQGIVTTVDNFGIKGDVPSNPELLDYLATEFVRDGWSVKKLVRTIVLTHAYQLGGDAPESHREADPANRLIWRHSPHRLDAEEMRDTMLVTSGRLQTKPEASASKDLKMIEMRDNGAEARTINEKADRGLYRSVYLPLLRGVTPKALEAFDPVSQTLVTGQREATTVPTQALYLLNSTFVRQQSLALAQQLLAEADRFDIERIRQLYLLTLGRQPSEREAGRAEAFLADYAASSKETPLVAVNTPTTDVNSTPTETTDGAGANASAATAANPDDVDRATVVVKEDVVEPKSVKEAAWMSLAQALYGSAEFRFVR